MHCEASPQIREACLFCQYRTCPVFVRFVPCRTWNAPIMTSTTQTPNRRFRFRLGMLLVLISTALASALAIWFVCPPPIDVAITVERFSWLKAHDGHTALEADVRVTNRSRHTVWFLQNPLFCTAQLVDGQWQESSQSSLPDNPAGKRSYGGDWWLPLESTGSFTIRVGLWDGATAMKVVVACTTDRFIPKRHWVSTPEVRIVKRGNDYFPETEHGADCAQSVDAPAISFATERGKDGKRR